MNVLYLIILILKISKISKCHVKTTFTEIVLKTTDINESDLCHHQHDSQINNS